MRILSLVLGICLVFGSVAFSGAECDDTLYDCPLYAATYTETYDLPVYNSMYPGTPDTDWIPGTLIIVNERVVAASRILTP
jgi:hypothetical protein